MNQVMYQTRLLNQEIKNSNEYNHYRRINDKIKQSEQVYKRLKDFQKKNFRLQSTADYNTLDDVKHLRDEYADILDLAIVREYLGAEQRLLSMLRNVEEGVLGDLLIDTDAMDD